MSRIILFISLVLAFQGAVFSQTEWDGKRELIFSVQESYATERLLRVKSRLASVQERFGFEESSRAVELVRMITDLLKRSQDALTLGKPEASIQLSSKAEILIHELVRMGQEADFRNRFGNPLGVNPFPNERDFHDETIRARAWEQYQRIEERMTRFQERLEPGASAASGPYLQKSREWLFKAKEALNAGKARTSMEYTAKAEKILSDWTHRFQEHHLRNRENIRLRRDSAPSQEAPSAWESLDKVEEKINRAKGIVEDSGDRKAAIILGKAIGHFQKARSHAQGGLKDRLQVEIDIALKLAAKAVDIAMASGRN